MRRSLASLPLVALALIIPAAAGQDSASERDFLSYLGWIDARETLLTH